MTILGGIVVIYMLSTLAARRGEEAEESIVLKDVHVQVLNGCGVRGAGRDVANALRLEGYDVVDVGNADTFDFPETMVIDRAGEGGRAREIARALGVKNVVIQRMDGSQYDATVIVGKDYRSERDG